MNIEEFTAKLTEAVYQELHSWRFRFAFDTMRAFCLSVIPFEGYLAVNFLTTQEDEVFDEEKHGKWDVAAWRWVDFTGTFVGDWPQVKALGLLDWMVERVEETDDEMEFVKACVTAITDEKVRNILKEKYRLTEDFELGVFKGDGGNIGDDINHAPAWNSF